jgi:hypothetical protein
MEKDKMSGDSPFDGMVEDRFHQTGLRPVEPGDRPVEAGDNLGQSEPNHAGLHELRELADHDADPGQEPEAWALPPPPDHLTGTQLRKRFVTEESIAELEAATRPSLLQRLFRRK